MAEETYSKHAYHKRLEVLEAKVTQLDKVIEPGLPDRVVAIEKALAVREVEFQQIIDRLDAIERVLRWVGFTLGGVVLLAVGKFVVGGGLV